MNYFFSKAICGCLISLMLFDYALADSKFDNSSFNDSNKSFYDEDSNLIKTSFSNLNGIWQSKGYGYIIQIQKGTFTKFEVSSAGCLKSVISEVQEIDASMFHVLQNPKDNRLHTRLLWEVSDQELLKLKKMPQLCQSKIIEQTSNPVINFNVLWNTFNEQYAFFKERNVNWQKVYKNYINRVDANTSNDELLQIFSEMLLPLKDLHVGVSNPINGIGFGGLPRSDSRFFKMIEKEFNVQREDPAFFEILTNILNKQKSTISEYLIRGGQAISSGANNQLVWGRLSNKIGYLNIDAMQNFTSSEDPKRDAILEMEALESGLNEALTNLNDVDRLVIDVRTNGGGADRASQLIANHFADKKRFVFSVSARDGDGFTPEQKVYIEPTGLVLFNKPVTLLIGPLTGSAAETFALYMRTIPNVTVMGERTLGILSDILEKKLPNGWSVNLSNERYTASDSKIYEGKGVPPQIVIFMSTLQDRNNNKDSTLDRIINGNKK